MHASVSSRSGLRTNPQDAKQQHGREPVRHGCLQAFSEAIHTPAELPRHRGDFLLGFSLQFWGLVLLAA